MAPTRDASLTVIESIQRDPLLAKLILDGAVELFINGEPDVARLQLRDLVKGTIGFEKLAQKVNIPSKSLHRMLSLKGNPNMDNISAVFTALRQHIYKKRPARAAKAA
jgi:DNA-binding phage protein